LRFPGDLFGGGWADDGSIYVNTDTQGGLMRVSESGGSPTPVTTLAAGEVTHRWPQILPGGKALLFTVNTTAVGSYDDAGIAATILGTGRHKIVQRGGFHGRFIPDPAGVGCRQCGYLVYIHQGALYAVQFDAGRLETKGSSVSVVEGISNRTSGGAAQFDISVDGSLVYLPGGTVRGQSVLFWQNAGSEREPLRPAPAFYRRISFAPEGRRIALEIHDGSQYDIWVWEWSREAMTRFSFDGARSPAWTPDGTRLAFSHSDKGHLNIYWKRTDASGDTQRLTDSVNDQWPESWHPSGKYLAFVEDRAAGPPQIMILPMEGDEKSGWKRGRRYGLSNGSFPEIEPAFSPDGRWLAYVSNESRNAEVYVRPFPGPGGRWQVSTGGGYLPTWSRNGKELFFRQGRRSIMGVSYTVRNDVFQPDKPRLA
jgi:hypothetical protein